MAATDEGVKHGGVQVHLVDRKSPVLGPSSLACLRQTSTINLTAGCAHQCLYCYTRGYSSYPGEGRIDVYANAFEKLRDELRRKRSPVRSVYFSPSSDLFQPVPEVLDAAYKVLELLLKSGVRVAFLTKGVIPTKHMQLLAEHAPLVFAEIGLICLDDSVLRLFEPAAARACRRLEQIDELLRHHIKTEARIDPIIPGFTDDEVSLKKLLEAVAWRGVKSVAVSTLFLRPAISASLRRHLSPWQFAKLMNAMSVTESLNIHSENSSVQAMSNEARRAIYARVARIAAEFGIECKVCACKNPDVNNQSCGISGQWQCSAGAAEPQLFG